MAILIIERSSSTCSNCPGSSVSPQTNGHYASFGGWSGNPAPSCGEQYTAVYSPYSDIRKILHLITNLPITDTLPAGY